MEILYIDYYHNCLILPVRILLFFSFTALRGAVFYLKDIITKGLSAESAAMFLVCFLIWLFFFRIMAGYLYNGGIYLLREKEEASITTEGTVEEIIPFDEFSFPNIRSYHHEYGSETYSNTYGCRIVVDDLILKAPDSGPLSPGDHVSVTYLPKSGFILSISKTASEP